MMNSNLTAKYDGGNLTARYSVRNRVRRYAAGRVFSGCVMTGWGMWILDLRFLSFDWR